MKEIGGFFEIELDTNREFHDQAIKLNSGRNTLLYLLKAKPPKKIIIPYYTCNAIIEPIQRENIAFEFYNINENFEPIIDEKRLGSNVFLLVVNYFGINEKTIQKLSAKYENLIIDNAQAFFAKPVKGLSTLYSARKFFGVPDGGYLYTKKLLDERIEEDFSYKRCEHLLKRMDVSAKKSYGIYLKNEEKFKNMPIRRMSKLTQRLLTAIDYKKVKSVRERNFLFIHNTLGYRNELSLSVNDLNGPMVYPLLISKVGLKEFLLSNKIYVATYWKDVFDRVQKENLEYKMTKYLIPLPIDQRYGMLDMRRIVSLVNAYI